MANTTYQSPVINTLPKGQVALTNISILMIHIVNGTGGYPNPAQIVSFDFNITTPNVFTIVLTGPLPSPEQVARYSLSVV